MLKFLLLVNFLQIGECKNNLTLTSFFLYIGWSQNFPIKINKSVRIYLQME